ncbi:hypothetical protein [Gracilibacillus lacisalsi]|uniref:hypothetical protein n=1 Tax=Gracilibacillus lacisalsi TaxID=393087 RepID=UPI000381A54E|nr:hypothetical protein [Gracilibacillus lacisalsi]
MLERLTIDYKKFLVDHYVFDSWQFLVNAQKNIATADYCYKVVKKLLSKMEEEHLEWQDEFKKRITDLGTEKGSISIGYDDMPQYNLNVLGMDVGYPFFVDKYVKDFFQYLRNAFDSIAQAVNTALLANESKNIERVDFIKIYTALSSASFSQKFPKTLDWFSVVKDSSEFSYISEFNNRIKHISDARVIMSQNLFNDDKTNKIDAFFKKGIQFSEQDILTITEGVMGFVNDKFKVFLDVLTEEIKLDTFSKGRIHNLNFYGQQIKNDPDSSFNVIFIEVESSIDELEDIIRILLINKNDDIYSMNCDYDEILVRDQNEKYIGKFILDDVSTEDGLLRYRKYKKEYCDGMYAFINQSRKKLSVKPFFMSGKIVRVGFDDPEV